MSTFPETISGIPLDLLSKSFPGIHINLFKFLFRNDPKIKLTRIVVPLKTIKNEPEEPPKEPCEENLIHLGEIHITESDVKIKLDIDQNIDIPAQKHDLLRPSEIPKVEESDMESDSYISLKNLKKVRKQRSSIFSPKVTRNKIPKIKCDICNKLFAIYYINLHKEKVHLKKSKGVLERPLKCTEKGCKKTYLYEFQLKNHLDICHRVEDKTYTCSECGATFEKYNLYWHHEQKCKPNQMCEFCPKIFHRKADFLQHRNTHTKEVKYECGDCFRIFYRSNSLRAHRQLHKSNAKPFFCSRCSKSFQTNAFLNRHMKNYHENEEKELSCPHCPKKYSKLDGLRLHIGTYHKRERNLLYKCEFEGCGETFSGPIHLQKHQDGHNGVTKNNHLCSKCGKSFESFIRWNNHETKYCKK